MKSTNRTLQLQLQWDKRYLFIVNYTGNLQFDVFLQGGDTGDR